MDLDELVLHNYSIIGNTLIELVDNFMLSDDELKTIQFKLTDIRDVILNCRDRNKKADISSCLESFHITKIHNA